MMGQAHSASAAPGAGSAAPQCPVPHAQRTADHPLFASMHNAAAPAAAPARGARGPVYNVYGQEIDPTNMMPAPNQSPTPGQAAPLSTARVPSGIRKGGTDGTWLYPSPQMFWNSLHRKGKAEGVREGDVDMVVTIHNEMNERTWRQLQQWEALHAAEHLDGEPALRHFKGNPYKLSPKAQLRRALGLGTPFDRHDWFVDRGRTRCLRPARRPRAAAAAGLSCSTRVRLANSRARTCAAIRAAAASRVR